jgi:transposase-like protein
MPAEIEAAITRVAKRANCPRCHAESPRHSIGKRRVRDVLGTVMIRYSKHYCPACRKHFSLGIPGLAQKCGRYSLALKAEALGMVRAGITFERIAEILHVPATTIHEWSKADVVPATA